MNLSPKSLSEAVIASTGLPSVRSYSNPRWRWWKSIDARPSYTNEEYPYHGPGCIRGRLGGFRFAWKSRSHNYWSWQIWYREDTNMVTFDFGEEMALK